MLKATVVMKHATEQAIASRIIRVEKPSFEFSGIKTPAYRPVAIVHMMTSTWLHLQTEVKMNNDNVQ